MVFWERQRKIRDLRIYRWSGEKGGGAKSRPITRMKFLDNNRTLE